MEGPVRDDLAAVAAGVAVVHGAEVQGATVRTRLLKHHVFHDEMPTFSYKELHDIFWGAEEEFFSANLSHFQI